MREIEEEQEAKQPAKGTTKMVTKQGKMAQNGAENMGGRWASGNTGTAAKVSPGNMEKPKRRKAQDDSDDKLVEATLPSKQKQNPQQRSS